MISCHGKQRAAYGWQRDGGHAEYLLAEENTCIHLPDNLTYVDGALIACGFGTAWEALTRIGVNGRDRLLITGLGPVGLAAAQLGKALGAYHIIGVDTSQRRIDLAVELGVIDDGLLSDNETLQKVKDLTGGKGTEASIDCSGASPARKLAIEATRQWGRVVFVGEGGTVQFDVSPALIHPQITLYGSWVTSLDHMAELVERLSVWNLHPDKTVTHRFTLDQAAEAYDIADKGQSGKVVIVYD
jgi:threonine dehydrogenase-like Zn-dependent dehydrogenase